MKAEVGYSKDGRHNTHFLGLPLWNGGTMTADTDPGLRNMSII